MLLGLFVENMIAVKQHIYVFALRHLHSVSVYGDTKLFIAALGTVRLDFLWCFVRKHSDG